MSLHFRKCWLFICAMLVVPIYSAPVFATQQCDSKRVVLQMLGTRGPELLDERASTSYLVWLDGKAKVIVDTGPGSVQRFKQAGANFNDVRVVLFSHFHADHSADFAAYIKGAFFNQREDDLQVVGPSESEFKPPISVSAEQFVNVSVGPKGLYPYLAAYTDPEKASSYNIHTTTVAWSFNNLNIRDVYEDSELKIQTVPVHHGAFPALGYRVELAGCVLSFSGDMSGRLGAMPDLAVDSDILVAHNAVPEDVTGVAALLHMTPTTIGKISNQASVKKLLLTHLMSRSLDQAATLQGVRQHYAGEVVFPSDLDKFHP